MIFKPHSLTSLFLLLFCSSLNQSTWAMDIVFEPNHDVPLVNLSLLIHSGSTQDPEGKSGLSNFVGELLLRGTQKHSKQEINSLLDQMGADLGVETRTDSMVIRGSCLSESLPKFLTLLEEILTQPTFHLVEINKLKKEFISGLTEEQSRDASLASKNFASFLFQTHPYGRPVTGVISSIQAFNRQDIQNRYAQMMVSSQLSLFISGQTSIEPLNSWRDQLDQKLSSRPITLKTFKEPESPSESKVLLVEKANTTQAQIFIGQIGIKLEDKDYFPLFLANEVFGGGGFQSRLMQEIRVKRGWSYSPYSYFRFGLQKRYWLSYVYPGNKDLIPALLLTQKMIADLSQNGITQEEFNSTQKNMINSSYFTNNTPKKRIENRLLEKSLHLPEHFFDRQREELSKLTLKQVNDAIRRYFTPEKLVYTVLAPPSLELEKAFTENLKINKSAIFKKSYTQEP